MLLAAQFKDLHSSKQINSLIHAEDPIVLLSIKIYAANADDLVQFVGSRQFDVEEPKTHTRAI